MSAQLDRRRLWRLGAVAAVAAMLANLVIYGIALAAGVSFDFALGPTGTPATTGSLAGAIVVTSLLWFAIGLALTSVVARRAPHRLRTMQIVAAVVTVLSFAQPLLLDADLATRLSLLAMHPLPGVAFVLTLQRLRPASRASDAASPATA